VLRSKNALQLKASGVLIYFPKLFKIEQTQN